MAELEIDVLNIGTCGDEDASILGEYVLDPLALLHVHGAVAAPHLEAALG